VVLMRIYKDKSSLPKGKKAENAALKKRLATSRKDVDQSMRFLTEAQVPCTYYYCIVCGAVSDILNFEHKLQPKKLCPECEALK